MSRKSKNKVSTKKPIIDVVVTFAGRFDMLEKCLDALYREAQTTPLTIHISDIDSPQEERNHYFHLFEYNPEKDPNQNVIQHKFKRFLTNVGYPKGANDGAFSGHAPLIMILNDDVELQSGAIQEVVNTFQDETVGIVGIKLLFPQGTPNGPAGKVQHVGVSLDIHGNPIHPLIGWSPEHPKTNISRDVWAVTGACITIRRDLFMKLHGFNAIYGKGTWEDIDLCLQSWTHKKRVYVNTKAVGYHYTGASQEKRKENFPLMENMQIFRNRWKDSSLLMWDMWTYL